MRAKYNLKLPDAFQIAVALAANCNCFFTNDVTFRRVKEIKILVLDDFEPME
jgi:predicted nucleic acid-binding protein